MCVTYVMNTRPFLYTTDQWRMGADGLQSTDFVYELEVNRWMTGDESELHTMRLQAIAKYGALLRAGQNNG